jgi:hypothetical protein
VWQAAKAEELEPRKRAKTTRTAFRNHRACDGKNFLSFDDTMFDSPIRDARICSLLETEGEATGVSVATTTGTRTGAERARTTRVRNHGRDVS